MTFEFPPSPSERVALRDAFPRVQPGFDHPPSVALYPPPNVSDFRPIHLWMSSVEWSRPDTSCIHVDMLLDEVPWDVL